MKRSRLFGLLLIPGQFVNAGEADVLEFPGVSWNLSNQPSGIRFKKGIRNRS
jgi:hypothetical protein